MKNSPQSGFSLVELLVAVTVTMIVSGAVYGLLASGQGAFRKEPALSDRQANIRSAMDQIVKDLSGAGAGMPPFAQVFMPGLDSPGGGPPTVVVPNLGGGVTDELMILTDTSGALPQLVCDSSPTTIDVGETVSPVAAGQSFTIFLPDNRWTVRFATGVNPAQPAAGTCTGPHTRITFAGGNPLNVGGGLCAVGGVGTAAGAACTAPMMVSAGRVVAYRIRPDAAGVPNLEQQTSENWGVWQAIFPGIEDLQVRYQDGDTAGLVAPADFMNSPDAVTVATTTSPTVPELNNLVRRVEVTLSARTVAGNLTGQTTSAAGSATRGRLQTITTMRPALETMSQAGLTPPYPIRF